MHHLVILSSATVHTSGINWESLAAIAGILVIVQSALFWVIARRDKKREDQSEEVKVLIADAINHQTEVLLSKLETKETVAKISERLARVEGAAGIKENLGR